MFSLRILPSVFVLFCLSFALHPVLAEMQSDAKELFEFAVWWHQPVNAANAAFDLANDGVIDEQDLLILLKRRRSVAEEIVINLPNLPQGALPLTLVKIPAGSFMMGRYAGEVDSRSDEDPQHQVNIGYEFYIGKYELTKAQWQALMGTTPWQGQSYVLDDPNSPAIYVSWNDIRNVNGLLDKLNALGQGTFRLPSEAEWEYCCRAGTSTRFYWGDDPSYAQIGDYAWYTGNAWDVNEKYAHIVGLKLPNAFGLYDMSGNVYEWCEDWYHSSYTNAPSDGSAWITPVGSFRVLRGGYWNDYASYCRSANRNYYDPDGRYYYVGLRVVRTP